MSRNKLNIPKTLHVGFQNRQGTYTGKLAYVTYTDEKGKHRKKKSWDTWRDHGIAIKDLDNEPTSGFVLNKKVGETRWGWNPRKAWVRVYDPRDFEFEISVANLLFILEECSAIKGKGLEGEFVYSWDGTELVLLPVTSQEFKASSEFTSLQTKKVTKKDMREGCLYVNKDNEKVMYLGRHDWYEKSWRYYDRQIKHSKQHVFVSIDGKSKYWTQKGFTKLAQKLGDDVSPLFPKEFEKFMKSIYASPPAKLVGKKLKVNVAEQRWHHSQRAFIKKKGKFYSISVGTTFVYPQLSYRRRFNQSWDEAHAEREKGKRRIYYKIVSDTPAALDSNGTVHLNEYRLNHSDYTNYEVAKEEIDKLEFFTLHVEMENGTTISA